MANKQYIGKPKFGLTRSLINWGFWTRMNYRYFIRSLCSNNINALYGWNSPPTVKGNILLFSATRSNKNLPKFFSVPFCGKRYLKRPNYPLLSSHDFSSSKLGKKIPASPNPQNFIPFTVLPFLKYPNKGLLLLLTFAYFYFLKNYRPHFTVLKVQISELH